MLAAYIKAKRFRLLLWILLTVSLALWAYLRHLGFSASVDLFLLIALLAEAALILGYRPAQ